MAKLKDITKNKTSNSYLNLQPSFPPQKLPEDKKNKEWVKQNVDTIISFGYLNQYNRRSSKYKKQINYDIVNSIFDENDFEYILNPYGLKDKLGSTPEKMQNFNIVRPAIERLKGEELARPFSYTCVAVGGESFNIREQVRNTMIGQYVDQMIKNQLAKAGLIEEEIDPETGQPVEPKNPEQIDLFLRTGYKDKREITSNNILKYLEHKEKFKLKFNKGFEHALVSGEEVYYVGIVSNEPVFRVVNPVMFDYDKSPDLENIEDAQWCREERYLASGAVIDEFGEFLTEEEIRRIDNGELGYSMPNTNMYPGYTYSPEYFNGANIKSGQPNSYTHTSHIHVVTCCWKSMRKIGFVSYTDEKGEEQEQMIDSGFKMTPQLESLGAKVEWRWISEVWKATRLGNDIYVDYGPIPNQYRSMDNPSTCKLPYIGRIYSSVNSQSTSFVDLCKPHQYTYLIVWYRLLNELAKAKGKKMVMDIAQIPKSEGFDLEKWMHYFDNLGIAFINSMEEGREGDPNIVSKFNQFTALDLSMSNTVQTYMSIIEKLENMMGELIGVNRQRLGDIKTSETVGNVTRAMTNSAMITEAMFYQHDLVKQQVLSQLVETAKLAYINGKRSQYILDDGQRMFLEVDGIEINDTEFGVFVSNSDKDMKVRETLIGLSQAALQNNKISLSELVKIMNSNSSVEIEKLLSQGEERAQQMAQQEAEQQRQHEMQIEQMRTQDQDKQRNWESTEKELDRQNKIELAQITAMGYDTEKDYNNNNIPDVLEVEKLRRTSEKDQMDFQIKQEQNRLKAKELEIKEKQGLTEDQKYLMEQQQQNKHHKENMDIKKKELEIKKKQSNKKPSK